MFTRSSATDHTRGTSMRRSALIVSLALLAVSATGCKNFIQKSAMDTTTDVLFRARVATQQESDVDLASQAIPASLKTVEGFYVANPSNPKLVAMLAEGWCQYTTGFIQDAYERLQYEGKLEQAEHERKRATALFLRCMNYGLKMLPKKWETTIYGDLDAVENLVAKAGKDEVPGMFWTALGLASVINMNRDDITLISHLPKARLMLERVVALDETYANGLAHMGLGMMYSAQGAAIGGKPEQSKQHFDRVVELTGGRFLLAKVMMARTYAVINQQRDLYHKTLVEVLQTSPAVWPEQRLANELAHVRARRYLAQEADFF
jgi:hypothetical protein